MHAQHAQHRFEASPSQCNALFLFVSYPDHCCEADALLPIAFTTNDQYESLLLLSSFHRASCRDCYLTLPCLACLIIHLHLPTAFLPFLPLTHSRTIGWHHYSPIAKRTIQLRLHDHINTIHTEHTLASILGHPTISQAQGRHHERRTRRPGGSIHEAKLHWRRKLRQGLQGRRQADGTISGYLDHRRGECRR